MEQTARILIIIHAASGGIALLAGLVAMIAKKGLKIHKKSGLLFFYSMTTSAISALSISLLPKHESPFLFAIGILSLYFILSGKRALRFKFRNPKLQTDKWISRIMLLTGILMIVLPIIVSRNINVVIFVFGTVAIIFSIRDLQSFAKPEELKKQWLTIHLGKMIGGYIAASTAFVVVNDFFPSPYGWFIPGVVGGSVIVYWVRKLKVKKANANAIYEK